MMRPYKLLGLLASFMCVALIGSRSLAASARTSADKLWVTAYYLSDDDKTGRLPLDKIDFHAISHLIHFGIFPNADGTIDQSRLITPKQSGDVIAAAHAAGCKVMVSLISDDGTVKLRSAISDKYRATFIQSIVAFVIARGYDGFDIDFEPLEDRDVANFSAFADGLRQGLDAAKPGLLLSAAVASEPEMFGRIQHDFDQINLMTYELSGLFTDFKSWYNSNLYGDPTHFMEHAKPYPSCDQMIRQFLQAGVSPKKLALASTFGGHVWTGVSGPRQRVLGRKDVTYDDDGDDYSTLMDKYYRPSRYRWDDIAHAPFLSIVGKTPAASKFIVYDDERAIGDKFDYARRMGLGGVMIWELGGGYRANQPEGKRDLLLKAVARAWMDKHTDASK